MIQGKYRVGKTKIDGFILGEVIIDMTGQTDIFPIVAHFALADSKSTRLFGKTTKATEWSEETLRKLGEFLEAVQNDIAAELFEDGSVSVDESPSNLPLNEEGIPEL